KRTIQRKIQDPLALKLLEGDFSEGNLIEIDVDPASKEFTMHKRKDTVTA
ncbi:MAG: hypothetical protein JRF22_05575, partial [Deltaproteobacteria bacterium]|nr:hypothetical protein [Deltaproteobacteria bacterium]